MLGKRKVSFAIMSVCSYLPRIILKVFITVPGSSLMPSPKFGVAIYLILGSLVRWVVGRSKVSKQDTMQIFKILLVDN